MNAHYYKVFDDLHKIDQFQIIIDIIEKAILPNVNTNDIYWIDVIANGYYKAKQYIKSIEWNEKLLILATSAEQLYNARFNLVQSYVTANYPEKAYRYATTNLLLDKDDWEMEVQKAIALYAMNRKDEARKIYEKILDNPNSNEKAVLSCEFNMGTHYLAEGKFQKGMHHLQLGRKMKIWGSHTHSYTIPKWNGEVIPGKSIIIIGEGGIGDEFINARFHKHIRDLGMIPHVASCHKNASVFERMGFESAINYKKFTTDIKNIDTFDYWAPMMDFPIHLNLDWNKLWYGPYVTVDFEYDKKWKNIISQNQKLNIGIKWSGNPLYEQQLHRTIPIKDIVKVIDKEKYHIVSLQKEHADDLSDPNEYPYVQHYNDKLDTIEDLIGAINQLDVIVTSCTSIAHIAGAMGKTTFVFVPIMNYYVWSEKGNKTSWYGDNVTLLKQQTPRLWNDQIGELKHYLTHTKS